jgi:hypothetical protein
MRLPLLLPKGNPHQITPPTTCENPTCQGKKFRCDTVYHEVQEHRSQCLKCGRTLRVYPQGVRSVQTSQRVKGLAVMLSL